MAKKPPKPSIQGKIEESILAIVGTKLICSQRETYDLYLEAQRLRNLKPYRIPKYLRFESDISRRHAQGMKIYHINARAAEKKRQILYLHGGSYISPPEIFHWTFLDKLAERTNAAITVPIYPKAPDHKYSEAYESVFAVYERMAVKTDPKNIILMGDSAGGSFALCLAQLIRDRGLECPGNIIMLSPWLDITMSNPVIKLYEERDKMLSVYGLIRSGEAWAGGDDPKTPLLSPIYGSLEGLGTLTLFAGTHEVLLPDARRLRDKARHQGAALNYYECEDMGHVFPLYPALPEAAWAQDIICSVIMTGRPE